MLSRARDNVLGPTFVVLALLALAPLVFHSASVQSVLVQAMIYAVGAIGLDLLTGYSGQYSFGQFVYFAVGAYLMSVLRQSFGLPWFAALAIAVAAAGVVAAITGSALVRLKFFGSAVGTFFMGAAAVAVLNGTRLAKWTGGSNGIPAPPVSIGSASLTSGAPLYYFTLIALVVAAGVALRYIRVRSGMAARVIKENETVAAVIGIRVTWEKVRAQVLAGMLAGLAGCLLAVDVGFLSPDTFGVNQSIELFAIVAVGGIGSISGPIIGAVFFFVIINALSSSSASKSVSGLLFSLLMLAVVVLFNGGLYDLGERAVRLFRKWASKLSAGRGLRVPAPAARLRAVLRPPARAGETGAAPAARQQADPGTLVLEVRDLTVDFGGVRALDQVSLKVRAGEIHAVIGPNGAGKTTLLNCISGIQPPAAGTVVLNGDALGGMPVSRRRHAGIARTFQHPSLVTDLNAVDNATVGAFESQTASIWTELAGTPGKRRRQRQARVRAAAALRALEFPHRRWPALAGDMTMGEQKHVDIARAISTGPALLLLDEPTAGLGAEEIAAVARAVKSAREAGVTILVIAHHVGFVREVADRCTVLDFGKVLAAGTPEEALADERVAEVFLGSQQQPAVPAPAAGGAEAPEAPAEPVSSAPVTAPAPAARGRAPAANGLMVEDLHVQIGGARIIEELSLSVSKGEIVGLAGRNGAGKTTTLRAISAVENRSRGRVTLDGVPLATSPERVARMGVAHVPEGRGIFPDLTVEENIRLGMLGGSRSSASQRRTLEEAFPAVARLRDQKAGRLSGGEQQMVALFRGLISRPEILLADEMSLGLSPRALTTVIEVLTRIGREEGIGMLVVDQNMAMLNEYCDRLYLLKDGHATLWDSTADLASAYFE